MRVLGLVCRGVTALNRWALVVAAALMFVVVPVILLEVVARYAFDSPTVWALELSALLFGPHFMLAGPYLLHVGGHVNVDILYSRFPPRVAAAVDLALYPVVIFFGAVMAWVAWPVAVRSYGMQETSFSAWNPEIWPFKFVIPIAMGLLVLQALVEFVRAFNRVVDRPDPLA
jgi:TRAP-type mannitol/chloroaromatic compound transport system permease small subunit